jgi:alkyl hydroperoxide reductase subunit AhpF
MDQFANEPLRLEIYISQHCWNCGEALQIAEQARQIAGIDVQVVDLDQKGTTLPPCIFAVPTYVLNGKIVSLGNPERSAFLARLRGEKNGNNEKLLPGEACGPV